RLDAQQLVEVAEQGAATRQDHALVGYIGRKLWRRVFEDRFDARDDLGEGFGDRLGDLGGFDQFGLGQTIDGVAAANLDFELALQRQGAADSPFDFFGGAVADYQVVSAADVRGDHLVDLVPADTQRLGDDDVVQR